MSEIPPQTLAWVEREVGWVRDIQPMPEASHTNHRLVIATSGEAGLEVVMRRYTDAERLGTDPWYTPTHEELALRTLEPVDLPVPRLVCVDLDPTECDVPTLVLTYLPGSSPRRPDTLDAFVRQLAEPLPAIHGAILADGLPAYEPYFVSDGLVAGDLRPPDWAVDPSVWERAFEAAAADPPASQARFIHRDYHQGNTLWDGHELSGIIDWTTGCIGPVGIDLAQMRVNLAWELDLETVDAFLDAWRSLTPRDDYHPYWDLLDAVDWLGDGEPNEPVPDGGLERYETFVGRTLAELG